MGYLRCHDGASGFCQFILGEMKMPRSSARDADKACRRNESPPAIRYHLCLPDEM